MIEAKSPNEANRSERAWNSRPLQSAGRRAGAPRLEARAATAPKLGHTQACS